MENVVLDRMMKLISPFSSDFKLELIAQLSGSLKEDLKEKKTNKAALLEELCGAWSDTKDDLLNE